MEHFSDVKMESLKDIELFNDFVKTCKENGIFEAEYAGMKVKFAREIKILDIPDTKEDNQKDFMDTLFHSVNKG